MVPYSKPVTREKCEQPAEPRPHSLTTRTEYEFSLTQLLDRPTPRATTTASGEGADAPRFDELGISSSIVESLAGRGITNAMPIQALTIPDAMEGRDVCGKAKTGSGKTLAFGLPIIERVTRARKRRPKAIVLVPTRELANQVADELAPLAEAKQLWITAIYGGASIVRQVKDLHAGVELVIATPGRLNDLLDRKELSLEDVEVAVLDEADQMADMGFTPQVRAILDRMDHSPQVLLFSATLDGSVGALVRDYLKDPVEHEVASPTVSVETLEQRFIGVSRDERLAVAAAICRSASRSIAFVRTKHGADRLAKQLHNEGLRADAIHGGLHQARRERTLADFSSGRLHVLVATNVAARGLHVDGVDVVLHYDLPEDAKTYLHRSGRTARAGAEGLVVTLVQPGEERDVAALQDGAGTALAVVPMGPEDERLADLASWEPPIAPARTPSRHSEREQPRGGAPKRQGRRFFRQSPGAGATRAPKFRSKSQRDWR